ncbi:MAG TPA: DUF1269 domain-containing protein [Casimicrobiaceae bacterium]|nr:DUF1269 domain-containing protein [Casimicrobiaceae bacterium]
MRRRLLFLLPDHASARRTMDDLLLARIEARHIHFLGRDGATLDGLNDASVLQRSDVVHAAQVGMLVGALLGCAAGAFVVMTLVSAAGATTQIVTVLGGTALGALLGAWASSMAGAAIPNSRLAPFRDAIAGGRILLMADVPEHRVDEIRDRLHAMHPEAEDRGLDPHVPVFP